MIFTHCFMDYFVGEEMTVGADVIVSVFNVVIGASAFMFCMGYTSNLNGTASPKHDYIRGSSILTVGLFLYMLVLTGILANFVPSDAGSYIPLSNWVIFFVVSAVFIFLAIKDISPFKCLSATKGYTWMNPIDGIGSVPSFGSSLYLQWQRWA